MTEALLAITDERGRNSGLPTIREGLQHRARQCRQAGEVSAAVVGALVQKYA